jgi:glycosyltransferase involved in cell wall biosynthesis
VLQGRNILIYSRTNWFDEYAKTIIELTKVFGEKNQVLYVDYQFTWKDAVQRLIRGDNKPSFSQIMGWKPRIQKLSDSKQGVLYLLTPPAVFPTNFIPEGQIYNWLHTWNVNRVNRSINRALKELEMQKDLIHINSFNPDFGAYSKDVIESSLEIYHCYDEISAADWAAKHGAPAEELYLPMVDATIVTSAGLLETKTPKTPQCYLVKNGVNFELFNAGYTEEVKKPIIGYVGAIDFRSDYNLLEACFKAYPNYEFHFVGKVMEDRIQSILSKYDNVKLLGSKPATELPAFLKTCAVGIIPFEINEFTKGVYPLKINEYLATGIPVLSTRFGQLDDFEQIASLHESPMSFVAALKEEIESDSSEKRKKRAHFAKQNSWYGRVAEFGEIINQLESQNHESEGTSA